MITLLTVLHVLVTLTLIGVVLIQRSEGGGLGIGSSQGMGSFMSGRGTANLLTRTTAVLAAVFMILSLALAVLNRGTAGRHDILALPAAGTVTPGSTLPATPVVPGPATPGAAGPVTPVAPVPGQ
jgi:preprotein translocase subunit SecG